jgi:catechol 2,3-dioxygenase
LGMALMAQAGDVLRFMSWDGYHHHLGINLLEGRGAAPVDADVNGVESFDVNRAEASSSDPDGIQVRAAQPA